MKTVELDSSIAFTEGLRIISRPADTDMGVRPLSPFTLSVSAETPNYNDLLMTLYSKNSNSIPYTSEFDNNWSRLKPQWRFTTIDGDNLDGEISVDFDTEIHDENGNVRGGVGTVSFYYIDDLPSEFGAPIMLQCTLDGLDYKSDDITAFYNSNMSMILPLPVLQILPSFIHFSANGMFELDSRQVCGAPITTYVTINGIPRSRFVDPTKCAVTYPIIFNIPNAPPADHTNSLKYTLSPLRDVHTPLSGIPEVTLEENITFPIFEVGSGIANGGWTSLSATAWVTSDNAFFEGEVTIFDSGLYFNTPSISMVIADTTGNTLQNIQSMYIDQTHPDLSGWYVTEGANIHNETFAANFNSELLNKYDKFNSYSSTTWADVLSGYTPKTPIAINNDGEIWTVDFYKDTVTRMDSTGRVLLFKSLGSLSDIPLPYKRRDPFNYDWYGPSSITICDNHSVIITLYNSLHSIRLTNVGDIIGWYTPAGVPEPTIDIDPRRLYRPVDVAMTSEGKHVVLYGNEHRNEFIEYNTNNTSEHVKYVGQDSRPDSSVPTGRASNIVAVVNDDVSDGSTGDVTICVVYSRSGVNGPARGGAYSRRYLYNDDTPFYHQYGILPLDNASNIVADSSHNLYINNDGVDGSTIYCILYNKDAVFPQYEYPEFRYPNFTAPTISFDIPLTVHPYSGIDDLGIGGMVVDSNNTLNIIDSFGGKLLRVDVEDILTNSDPYIDIIELQTQEPEGTFKYVNAFGYWTDNGGARTPPSNTYEQYTLKGSSTYLNIRSDSRDYDLRRENDSWDMHSQISSYLIPDYQKEFTSLWDDLIGNTVGNASSDYQTFGRQFYEKIANFVVNHSDLDIANISQVYSIFDSLSLDYNNYDSKYPADLAHWMNILSITFDRLRGSQYECNRNFKTARFVDHEPCEVCGNIHSSNMGALIQNPVMELGVPVVIRDTYKTTNAFDILHPPISGDYQQLSDHYGYRSPFDINYEVYAYIDDVGVNKQASGFIERDDVHNTLDLTTTDVSDWWKDGGIVEDIFTNILYSGVNREVTYTTDIPSEVVNVKVSIGDDLTEDNTTILDDLGVTSHNILPIKIAECSPISAFGLPFYTALPLSGIPEDATPIACDNAMMLLDTGVVASDKCLRLNIGYDVYYISLYSIDEISAPKVNECTLFVSDIVTPDHPLISAGYLLFEYKGFKRVIPIYK